jgi:hypothetical protein
MPTHPPDQPKHERRELGRSADICLTCFRYVRRDLWRNKAIEIRVAFERNRNVRDPRAVANLLNQAEKEVQRMSHPDPYRRKHEHAEPWSGLGGFVLTGWCVGPSQRPCSRMAQSGE